MTSSFGWGLEIKKGANPVNTPIKERKNKVAPVR
jgi:hypothetical protein